jgi:YggT family protein
MSQNQVSEVRTTQREPGLEQRIFTFKATYAIWLLLIVLETLILLRIGLKLIGANPDNSFAALIYGFTNLFLVPFAGLLPTPASGGMVLEISSFIAMIAYALVAFAIERVVWVIFYRPREQTVAVTQSTSSEQHTR